VEYLQANRVRSLWVAGLRRVFHDVDVLVAAPRGVSNLLTNLTGHPCVAVPSGFGKSGLPTSIAFCGRAFGEADILAVAGRYQEATGHHRKTPPMFR
jgi:Asp-tRNA(Asn)/Glu-tRNA(Gln) amidotransferase A subunit family amidase